jgi:hypothetical protein
MSCVASCSCRKSVPVLTMTDITWEFSLSVIVKTGTDLRQEQLATQLIERFSRIFKEEKSECWVRLYVAVPQMLTMTDITWEFS